MATYSDRRVTYFCQQIEPVMIDEIGIVLGSGPDGYRALFRNIQAYGVSNITVTNIRWVVHILTAKMLWKV